METRSPRTPSLQADRCDAAGHGFVDGVAGTDTAIESADVALMDDDLSKPPSLFDLAGRGNGVIKQNISSSLAAKAVLAAGVPFGLVPIWAAVRVGDAGMTLGVTGKAMGLARIGTPDLGA